MSHAQITWAESGLFGNLNLEIATINALPEGVKAQINNMIHGTFMSEMPEKDHLQEMHDDCRFALVVYATDGNKVAACSSIQWLRTRSEGLGIVSESLQFVIEMGSAVVLENYRGQGFGTAMIEARLTRGLQIMHHIANPRNGLASGLKLSSDIAKEMTFDARRGSKSLRDHGIVRTQIEHGNRNIGHKERFMRIATSKGFSPSSASQELTLRKASQVIVVPSDNVLVIVIDEDGVNTEMVKSLELDKVWEHAVAATGVEQDAFTDLGGAYGVFNTLKEVPKLNWDSNVESTMLAWGFTLI